MVKYQKGVNDLETYCKANKMEYLLDEWDYEKNIGFPGDYSMGSRGKKWWICKLGHSYEQRIKSRTGHKQGCPYCCGKRPLVGFNDLASAYPYLVEEWSEENSIKPTEVTKGSKKRVEWICSKCGNKWVATINNRVNGSTCPFCAGKKPIVGINDFLSLYPEIAMEWDYENNMFRPEDYLPHSNIRSIYWICSSCGCGYTARISDRVDKHQGCPKCARRLKTSFPEQTIYFYVKQSFPDTINNAKGIIDDLFELDIYVPSYKLAIEYDGLIWHAKSINNDKRKYSKCREKGIFLIRIRELGLPVSNDIADIIIKADYKGKKRNSVLVEILDRLQEILGSVFNVDIDRDENDILQNHYTELGINSAYYLHPELKEEWDYEKNIGITLKMLSSKSKHKSWWKCKKCGYGWSASVGNRANGSGCPNCARVNRGTKISRTKIKQNGTLEQKYPEIIKEWDYEKNLPLTPGNVSSNNNKKVWWICQNGHSYQARISSRTAKNSGCPYCIGRKILIGQNDLASTHPALLSDWDFELNGSPEGYTAGSNTIVHWICHNCGYDWNAAIYSRTSGRGCMACYRNKRAMKH